MKWIKRYKFVLVGGVFVLLAVLVSSGKEAPAPDYNFARPMMPASPAGATSAGEPARGAEKLAWQEPAQPDRAENEDHDGAEDGREDTPADSTDEGDLAAAFDEEKVRGEALAEVEDFNRQLAGELRKVNPNARKARLKAAELKQKAQDLDAWISSRDTNANLTPEEQMEWRAQREVWVGHAKELKRVAQRLSATRGTKRKVRILAKEISDSLED